MTADRKNILDVIVAAKRGEVARLASVPDVAGAVTAALQRHGPRDFFRALSHPRIGGTGLIAEVKKASPTAGVIRADFDPVRIAREYEAAGADCLSVLTDTPFFQGSLEYLRQIRAAVGIPLLRKDFIIDERQIVEAAEWGADAILLIVAILNDAQLRRFHELAEAGGLAVLVEAHDESELDRALDAGARLIGVNNRDLKTFKVDLATSERLAERLRTAGAGREVLLVSESGIKTRQDVERLACCGARAILVGESLMRETDLAGKVAELLGGRRAPASP
jgi:indole-3-glycerol phosphate synthase